MTQLELNHFHLLQDFLLGLLVIRVCMSGLSIAASSTWEFITFSPNDPDTRYLRKDTDGSINGNLGLGTSSASAPLAFGKSAYGDQTSENFYRIKFTDFGGTANDVGIGS